MPGCGVEPDWVLIYRLDTIYFERTGTHCDCSTSSYGAKSTGTGGFS